MEEEHKGIALVILGIIAVIAVIGLVLMFSGAQKSTGAVFTNVGANGFRCDSPCTIFPSGSAYDTKMMEERLNSGNRKWVLIGQTKLDGTTTTGYGSADTKGGYNDPTLGCWCPVEGIPQFAPTKEYAAIIPGTSSADAKNAGRYAGTPVNQYKEVAYPANTAYDQYGQVPSYPYPGSLNK